MAKAFTEEEKIKIKEDIMETALDLFHEKGKKSSGPPEPLDSSSIRLRIVRGAGGSCSPARGG